MSDHNRSLRHLVIGTAGHIDHGKSTLVTALTGINPDRLQEEKTINLLQMQRLKKRKLLLKDKINYLRNKLEPDIIA